MGASLGSFVRLRTSKGGRTLIDEGSTRPERGNEWSAAEEFAGFHSTAVIDGRRLDFQAMPMQCRMRITLADPWAATTTTLGSVIRLDTDEPGLRVSAPLEVDWAATHIEEIIAVAVRVWDSVTRHCEG